jgi:hypothetical protein
MNKWNSLVARIALASTVLLSGAFTTRAAVDLTFSWDRTYYQAGYTAPNITSSDAIGIYRFNTSGSGIPNPFWSVCLSPAGLLDGVTHTYNVLSFADANPGIYPSSWQWGVVNGTPQYWGINNAAYLWNKYGMDIVNNVGNVGVQNQRAAALQFAVWAALYDSTGYGQLGAPNNWLAPTAQMDATTKTWYDAYVGGLTSSGLTGPVFTGNILESTIALTGPNSGGSQEFFLLGTPVPEPTTVIAGVLLLLPFGVSTIRILRRGRAV